MIVSGSGSTAQTLLLDQVQQACGGGGAESSASPAASSCATMRRSTTATDPAAERRAHRVDGAHGPGRSSSQRHQRCSQRRSRAVPSRPQRPRPPAPEPFSTSTATAASRPTSANTSSPRRGEPDAGALDQRHRQRPIRHADLGERQRLDLERERARVPPDAVVERPGQRRQHRGALPPRRRERPLLVADAAADAQRRPYIARHGFGYSIFEHVEDGIQSELRVFVAIDAPVKFSVLTLRNRSGRARRLSVTGYVEWVLGDERAKTLMHVVTELDAETGAVFARNAYNTDFAGRTAFFDVDEAPERSACGDRGDFFGRAGSLAAPAAMARRRCRPRRRRARSLRGAARRLRARARTKSARSCSGSAQARARTKRARWCAAGAAPRPRAPRSTARARTGSARSAPFRCARRSRRQRACQRLAALPGDRLAPLGPHRVLPVERRLRLSRPIAGRDGARPRRARTGARAPAARGRAPVRRRRRAALVASAVGQRHSHALLRRLPLAAVRDLPLRRGHRRRARARRAAAPSSTAGRSRTANSPNYELPQVSRRERLALRALPCARSATACATARMACR